MKKVYFFTVALAATTTVFSQDGADTLTFESYDLATQDYYNGSDEAGDIVIGNFTLSNSYNSSWGSWNGFAVSKVQDITTAGFGNQYASFANGGAAGSSQYGMWYSNGTIEFNTSKVLKSIQITNATYAAISMRDGDEFAKQFGSVNSAAGTPDGTNGEDWFLLQIVPLDENDVLVGDTIDFYLADYRFADDNDDYIVDSWETIDLGNVTAKKLAFVLSSSDNGEWGMNTPGYFSIDNLVANNSLGIETLTELNAVVYPNPAHGQVTIAATETAEMELLNAVGQVVKTAVVNGTTTIDVNGLPAGIYHVALKTLSGASVQKLIIQ